jgi:serine/threonine protein phosphatase 1
MIRHFDKNTVVRDYVVGDIHGCFSKLHATLNEAGFNRAVDRLFSVGDLVDKGLESESVIEWLAKPWFFPVRGNHDDFAIRHALVGNLDFDNYTKNGGSWFMALPIDEQIEIALALDALPYAISVDTDMGLIGIVHADIPFDNWQDLVAALNTFMSRTKSKAITNCLLWSRDRIESGNQGLVDGIAHLLVGHTPVNAPTQLGNVIYIDTIGWADGSFTLAKIQG